MTDAHEGPDLPAEVVRLVGIVERLREEPRAALGDAVAADLDAVVAAMPGTPWETLGRYVAGMARLARGQQHSEPHGAAAAGAADPELVAGVELLRPLARSHPELLHAAVRGVLQGTHQIVGRGIVEVVELWNGRLADRLGAGDSADPQARDRAAEAFRQVERLSEDDHPRRVEHLINMSSYRETEFRTGQGGPAALDDAIRLARLAVAAPAPPETHALAQALLGSCLVERIDGGATAAEYLDAIAVHRAAVAGMPADSPHAEQLRVQLAGLLGELGNRNGRADLLGDALEILRELRAHTADGAPRLRMVYAIGLGAHAHLIGAPAQLADAADIMRQIAAQDEGELGAEIHHNLANALSELNEQVSDPSLDEEAIAAARRALALEPIVMHHSNLGMRLREAFERTNRVEYLGEAIGALRAACDTGAGDPYRPRYLGRLGHALVLWADRTGDSQALREAVECLETAGELTAADDSFRASHTANLGLAHTVAMRWGRPGARESAVAAYRAALALLPSGHIKRGRYLSNLSAALMQGDDAERAEAVGLERQALAATGEDQPDRSLAEGNLAGALFSRYRREGDPALLDEALRLARSAASRRFQAGPRIRLLLAELQLEKARSGGPADLRAALDQCRAAAEDPSAGPAMAVEAASLWGRGAAGGGLWAEATTALALAVRQFPQLTGRELGRGDRQTMLAAHSSQVATDAAACALHAGDPGLALELLEAGRGVLIGQALELRDDVELLAERAPDLVAAFEGLRSEIEALERARDGGPRPGADPAAFRDWRERWTVFMALVRARPGLARFQLPATRDELLALAGDGPIAVLNVSAYRCDGLLLTPAGLIVVPLPELSADDVRHRLPAFVGAVDGLARPAPLAARLERDRLVEQTLAWLWTAAAEPVLEALGHREALPAGRPWPRVRWLPTGFLAFYPLHAAGRVDRAGATVLDRVVSSYASTLAGLRRARRGARTAASGPGLVVSVPALPGHVPLPGATAEAAAIGARFPDATVLAGPAATGAAVLAALPGHDWVHLSCHGYADIMEPARSRLHLHDGPLTVGDLWQLRMTPKPFAFLAACDSAQGAVLTDEALHLTAMFQAAGYRHVIGSLWPIADGLTARLTADIYAELAAGPDPDRAAGLPLALHHATRRLRAAHHRTPTLWAAHIHTGP